MILWDFWFWLLFTVELSFILLSGVGAVQEFGYFWGLTVCAFPCECLLMWFGLFAFTGGSWV